jgi:CheY-like chemotaxis protein
VDLHAVSVLLVDDDGDTREVVCQVLADRGAQVTLAASADEALDKLRRGRFDVLLSDIGMPGVDGYELIRRVRALGPDAGGALPAAAVTAFARREDRLHALHVGYDAHVTKPVVPSDVVGVVARLVRSR